MLRYGKRSARYLYAQCNYNIKIISITNTLTASEAQRQHFRKVLVDQQCSTDYRSLCKYKILKCRQDLLRNSWIRKCLHYRLHVETPQVRKMQTILPCSLVREICCLYNTRYAAFCQVIFISSGTELKFHFKLCYSELLLVQVHAYLRIRREQMTAVVYLL